MKNYFLICAIAVAAALLTGCQIPSHSKAPRFDPRPNIWSNGPNTITINRPLDPALLTPPPELFKLGPGDRVEVEMLGKPNSRALLTVGPDGKVYYDLLPGLDVWGLTLAQTRQLLVKELEKFMSMPEVSVTLKAVGSKFIWMLGQVNHPGIYPAVAPMTLLEAMSAAGGTARASSSVTTVDLADLRHAFVIRDGKSLSVDFERLLRDGDMSQNIYLQPGDLVFVPSGTAREIYLFGAVRAPRPMPLSEHPTLVAAIAAGGGPLPDAFVSQVAIVRGSLTSPEIAIVDYNDILKGRASDVELQPHDIVFVPYSPYRILTRYVDAALNTFMFTAAANAGTRAAGGASAIGTSVSVGN
jgi:polysaccharide biosynthesis/export protein